MRRTRFAPLLLAAAPLLLVGACRSVNEAFKISEEPPAHREPTTTSIYGDWVLATPSDSTAFAGASLVELSLARSSFTITATYPHAATTVVRGTAATADDGALLTLTPTSGTQSGGRGALVLVANQPVSVLASAAGNTMVFSPPGGVTSAEPSSVWHRKDAAKAAGTIPAKTP